MVLLILEGTYPWYRGGVSEWVHHYLEAFPDYDFKILQVATDEYLDRDINDSLYNLPSNVQNFVRILPPDLDCDWTEESARWKLANEKTVESILKDVDTIHVTNTGFAGWLGSELAVETDIPLVLTEHAIYWKEIDMGAIALECGYKIPATKEQRQKYVEMFRHMAKVIYQRADVAVSVSECNTAKEYSLGVAEKKYIPNGVAEYFFSNRNVETKKLELTVGWIGRCAKMKNPMRFFSLVDAFREISKITVSFKMMLSDAGEEHLKQEVIVHSKHYPEVELIWNEPAKNHIGSLDALCITSYNESQPLVLFEAIASKALPVGWSAGDANSKFGLFVDQQTSADDLANEIMLLWSNKNQWKHKVDACYDFVKIHHTWHSVFGKYREIFETIV
ncbi:MAG TPA: DUF3492 domain-containing protein [Balneolales bacterium]|nr:DUF3492 domain-containing protein [Balneolales bacterium]